ncbi:MAG: hypothetical protein DRJ64_05395 [Thermoprotei archaeon]|nr:MAG: hypothetical protein DRJ64_05395 [Thermoprotei archaeon]
MNSSLPVPPEPLELKKMLKVTLALNNNNIKILLTGNRIPAYLWSNSRWKVFLSRNGWTWQEFLKFISNNVDLIADWINGKSSWEDFISKLEEKIYSYKPLRDTKIL